MVKRVFMIMARKYEGKIIKSDKSKVKSTKDTKTTETITQEWKF